MAYQITVKQGNLLAEKGAAFIVNASNTRLLLGSGVSMAFKRHCGHALQNEMDKALEQTGGEFTQGDVVATSGGNAANFSYALHAAVMNYNKGIKADQKFPTIEVIETALQNIENYLLWYAKHKSKEMKLVLPLLGCGVGGLKKGEVISLYKRFFSREVPFECEVVVYGYTDEDYRMVKKDLG